MWDRYDYDLSVRNAFGLRSRKHWLKGVQGSRRLMTPHAKKS